jgi:uncharacterized membrane protein
MIGSRWVYNSNFSFRLGAALGFQNAFINQVSYYIIEQNDKR